MTDLPDIRKTRASVLHDLLDGPGDRFWRIYQPHVHRMATKLLRSVYPTETPDTALVDDIAQESAIRVGEKKAYYDRDLGRFKSWLWGVVRMCTREQVRKHKTGRRTRNLTDKQWRAIEKEVAAGEATRDAIAMLEWALSCIETELPKKLSPKRLQAFRLIKLHSMPAGDAAEKLGISEASARQYVTDVRRALGEARFKEI